MTAFRIREATPEDVPGMVEVRVDTWKATYKRIIPDDFLENLSYQTIAKRWKQVFWEDKDPGVAAFVAESEQDHIVGIAICGPEQSHDPLYRGEIYVLYVIPEYQYQGIGRKLVSACVQHFMQQLDIETMLIWVIADNPYRRFYESLGGKMVREKSQEIGGRMISEVGYAWENIRGLL